MWADALFDKNPPFKLVKVIEEGTQTLHPEFTADDKLVYIADWQENKARVYNATTFEKIAEIDGITTPTGIFSVERRREPLGHSQKARRAASPCCL